MSAPHATRPLTLDDRLLGAAASERALRLSNLFVLATRVAQRH